VRLVECGTLVGDIAVLQVDEPGTRRREGREMLERNGFARTDVAAPESLEAAPGDRDVAPAAERLRDMRGARRIGPEEGTRLPIEARRRLAEKRRKGGDGNLVVAGSERGRTEKAGKPYASV